MYKNCNLLSLYFDSQIFKDAGLFFIEMAPVTKAGITLLILSILSGLLFLYPESYPCANFIKEFYANISVELFSISITILIIDKLYSLKEKELQKKREDLELKNYKEKLIWEFGSSDIAFTSKALKELKARGWLSDGTLKGANLEKSNLSGLDLEGANLEDANLMVQT